MLASVAFSNHFTFSTVASETESRTTDTVVHCRSFLAYRIPPRDQLVVDAETKLTPLFVKRLLVAMSSHFRKRLAHLAQLSVLVVELSLESLFRKVRFLHGFFLLFNFNLARLFLLSTLFLST